MPRTLPDLSDGADRRLLLAASTGGHLAQLVRLSPGLGASDDSLWVTFRTPQSESLLQGRNVMYVPYIRPRDATGVIRAFSRVVTAVRGGSFAAAVSTGAGLALAALPAARLAGLPTLYVESVSRVVGPSLSGRILARLSFTEMRTQHPSWAGGRWGVHSSVLSTFDTAARSRPASYGRPRLFVTLGTIEGYGFDALVDKILALGLADENTVWQLGSTTARTDLPGRVFDQVSAADFDRYAREADAVITHAGVGTVLGLLEMGIYPLAVVRRRARGEHVDDHQEQIAALMNDLDIGVASEVDDLTADKVDAVVSRRISSRVAA